MMKNRIDMSINLLSQEASYLCHIDENEYERLYLIFDNPQTINAGTLIWDKRNPMNGGNGLATQHEYVIWRTKQRGSIYIKNTNVIRMISFVQKLIELESGINDNVRKKYIEWINNNKDLSGGEKAYRYIDDEGRIYQSVSLRAPEPRKDPKFHQPLIHPITNKPCAVPPNGFSRTPETLSEMVSRGEILFGEDETTQPRQKVFLTEESRRQMSTVIQDAKKGKADTDLLGVNFPYCHPVSFYETLIGAALKNLNGIVLDFFAGSGTTGHAVINLNREDGGNRKYILVEMGEYFDTVLKPRIQKVIYSKDWKDGKPVSREGISHMFKYIRLESYEDTMNNLELKRPPEHDSLFAQHKELREEYILSYMLDMETNGSASLLNLDYFQDPFNYKLKITRNQETREEIIDLVETFNYLLGLRVQHIEARETFNAVPDESAAKPGTVKLRIDKNGQGEFTFKIVTGLNPAGERVLIIWRNLTGDIARDNAALNAYFTRKGYNTRDNEFDRIYVNGDNNLANLAVDEGNQWKVLLIEEEFKRLMFDVQDV
ncbi:DNA-cytosine methyltransferase [Desulforamulus profundi]|uniref:DNA-cytosine methyltransferase n=2 Tax=Desulforamulus profundi TaxID=1383067 RepID=A0A2C6MBG6_9FIRM|nr:DNA-cytosine methyltransferase [Desulforamulus profundi]